MRIFNMENFCKFFALAFACILAPASSSYSADCFVQITKAEKRWDAMRDSKALAIDVKRSLTAQLTLAAELRHQGRVQECLIQTGKAMKEMDLLEAGR